MNDLKKYKRHFRIMYLEHINVPVSSNLLTKYSSFDFLIEISTFYALIYSYLT